MYIELMRVFVDQGMGMLSAVCLTFALSAAGCKARQDPAEYNNKVITIANGFDADMTALNSAMQAGDYSKAEAARKKWDQKLAAGVKQIEAMGAFNGDSSFKNASLASLKLFQEVATKDYPALIKEREGLQSGKITDRAKERALLNAINDKLEKASVGLNAASDAFEKSVSQ